MGHEGHEGPKSVAQPRMIGRLGDRVEPYGVISLTKKGLDIALKTSDKHRVLRAFFEDLLDVAPSTADSAACGMEHALPREAYVELARFVKFAKSDHGRWESFKREFNAFKDAETRGSGKRSLDEYLKGSGVRLDRPDNHAGGERHES